MRKAQGTRTAVGMARNCICLRSGWLQEEAVRDEAGNKAEAGQRGLIPGSELCFLLSCKKQWVIEAFEAGERTVDLSLRKIALAVLCGLRGWC